ncbi:GPI mannosyltransferase 2 [Hyaloraphidium curvatum]|nr:GPI mannosyltransferase 2 [Hyaloraphidium curvatum]
MDLDGITRLAAGSRVATLLLGEIACLVVGRPYDTSSDHALLRAEAIRAAGIGVPADQQRSSGDALLDLLFGCWVRWDAVYFLGIAEDRGYALEQANAFLPGLPMAMNLVGALISPLAGGWLSRRSILVLAGLLVSNTSFVLAARSLYRLTAKLTSDSKFAALSAFLFCLTPASPFVSSLYAESTFALATFLGMEAFESEQNLLAALLWAAASAFRANGILLAGFFVFRALHGSGSLLKRTFDATFCSCIVLSTFLSTQLKAFNDYCRSGEASSRPWCSTRIPSIYTFVQAHYWDNGFLKYFRLSNVPLFAVAAPTLAACAYGVVSFAGADPLRFMSIGFRSRLAGSGAGKAPFHVDALLPYVYLGGLLAVYTALMAHVQIAVRLFTSMPLLYWAQAHLMLGADGDRRRNWVRRAAALSTLHAAVGIVLFALFYPPA